MTVCTSSWQADSVLEIGSSYGATWPQSQKRKSAQECTQILAKHAGAVIGVDNSSELVEAGIVQFCKMQRRAVDGILFATLNCWIASKSQSGCGCFASSGTAELVSFFFENALT